MNLRVFFSIFNVILNTFLDFQAYLICLDDSINFIP